MVTIFMGKMKNIIPLTLIALMLIIGLFVLTPTPASLQEGGPKVKVEHVSASRMSDGSLTIYCRIVNADTVPVTNVSIDMYVLDSMGTVLSSKKLVFFSENSLMPNQKALFTETFEDCWSCEEVQVVPQ